MGTSGAGSGGSGTRGGGGGYRGGGRGRRGGGGGRGRGGGAVKKDKRKERSTAQKVLSKAPGSYLGAQFTGPLASGLAKDLCLLGVDILVNRDWDSMCRRLDLPGTASLADVREELLTRHEDRETDVRLRDTAEASLRYFFDQLSGFDDDVLDEPGNDRTFRQLDEDVARTALRSFLKIHFKNVLQREEPQILDGASQQNLEDMAAERGDALYQALQKKYGAKDQASEGVYLQRAEGDRQWLLKKIRN